MKINITRILILALVLFGAAGWIKLYFVQTPYVTVQTSRPKPIIIPQTKVLTKVRTVTKNVPVQVFVPTEKEAEKIEKKTGLPVVETVKAGDQLLGIWETPKAFWGGNAMATLLADGSTRFTFIANKRPFFELGGVREIKFGFEKSLNTDVNRFPVAYNQDLFRVGPLVVEGGASIEYLSRPIEGKNWDQKIGLYGAARF